MVRWLARPLGLPPSARPPDRLGSKSLLGLCHLKLRRLCLRPLSLFSESVRVVARRHVGLVLDALDLQVGSYLLEILLVSVLLLEVAERVGLGGSVERAGLHLLLGAFLKRVPLLLEFVDQLLVNGFERVRGGADVLNHLGAAVGYAVAEGAQTPLYVGLHLDRNLDLVFVDVAVVEPESEFEQAVVGASIFLDRVDRMRKLKPTLVAPAEQPRTGEGIVHARDDTIARLQMVLGLF